MKIKITNEKIKVGDIKISGVATSSIVLIGDAETITSSAYFDTPTDSLIFSKQIPVKQDNRKHVS